MEVELFEDEDTLFTLDGESENEQETNLEDDFVEDYIKSETEEKPGGDSKVKLKKGQQCVNVYLCSFCGYQTPFRYILKRHYIGCQLKTDRTDKWKCSRCHQIFTHHSHLRQHKLKVHLPKNHTCNNCFFETTNQRLFEFHFVNGKCPKRKMFKCDKCPFVASLRMKLINHEKTHNPNRAGFTKRTYMCTQCNRRIGSHKLFKRHLMCHATVQKNYCCEYCEFTTLTPEELEQHKTCHTDMQEMVLVQCSRCDFKGFSLTELKEHLQKNACIVKEPVRDTSLENGDKSPDDIFNCHLCSFITKYLHLLSRHCRTVHHFDIYKKKVLSQAENVKGYACTRCSFVTKYFSNLSRHIRNIHCLGNKGLPSLKMNPLTEPSYLNKKGSKFACTICQIVIVDEYQLAYHRFVEHRDQTELFKWKFACTLCTYHSVSKKLCFKHGKLHVKQPSCPKVAFRQLYEGRYKSTFIIDYIKNRILIKTKTSINKRLSDKVKKEELSDETDNEEESEGESLEIKNKLDVLSYIEDKCVEEPEAENIQSILDWTVSDDEELVAKQEIPADDDDDDEVIIIEIVPDDLAESVPEDFCLQCQGADCHCDDYIPQEYKIALDELKEEDMKTGFLSDESDREDDIGGTSTKKGMLGYHCQLCGDVLNRSNLNSHTNVHASLLKNINLEVTYEEHRQNKLNCFYKLKANPGSLQKFYQLGKPTYKCQMCGVLLYAKKSLQNHTNLHAREEADPDLEVSFSEYRNEAVAAVIVLLAGGPTPHKRKRARTFSPDLEYDPDLAVFHCDECNFKTNDEQASIKHGKLHWTVEKAQAYDAKRWLSCNLCFFHCFDIRTLKEHAAKHAKRPRIVDL